MRRWAWLALPLVLSCTRLERGEVLDKQFVPAHETHWIWMMPIVHSTGKSTYTTFIPIPMTSHYPDAWSVTIGDTLKGKWRERTVWVGEGVFEEVRRGDRYCVKPEDCDEATHTDVKKERH